MASTLDAATDVPCGEPMFPAESKEEFSRRVGGILTAAATNLMIALGDDMKLFHRMAAMPPSTPDEIAQATFKHERWIREWLHSLAAAKVISTDADAKKFWLTPEQADVLAHEDGDKASPEFLASPCAEVAWFGGQKDKMHECFRTGVGMTYDAYGKALSCSLCRHLGVWTRHNLLPNLKKLPGLEDRLRAGISVADLGCGCGLALQILALEFPNSTFHGFDTSQIALADARAAISGLANCELFDPSTPGGVMGTKRYDFMITLDAVHDMTRPDLVTKFARDALKDDAYGWLIADLKSAGSPAANIKDMSELAALAYAYSVSICMSSALSEAGGLGLGTMGWHAKLADSMLKSVGFSEVKLLDWDGGINQFYLASV